MAGHKPKEKMKSGGRLYANEGVYMDKKKSMSRTKMMKGGQPHYGNGEIPQAKPN